MSVHGGAMPPVPPLLLTPPAPPSAKPPPAPVGLLPEPPDVTTLWPPDATTTGVPAEPAIARDPATENDDPPTPSFVMMLPSQELSANAKSEPATERLKK